MDTGPEAAATADGAKVKVKVAGVATTVNVSVTVAVRPTAATLEVTVWPNAPGDSVLASARDPARRTRLRLEMDDFMKHPIHYELVARQHEKSKDLALTRDGFRGGQQVPAGIIGPGFETLSGGPADQAR
jgi:hypothetical protein